MIRFNLDKILKQYSKHFDPPLTINTISKDTGISRHALNTLTGKSKRPRGINFSTLNKLVSFFHLPFSSFFSYTNDDIKITLTNAKKQLITMSSSLMHSKHKLINGSGTNINIQNIHEPHGSLKIYVQPYISTFLSNLKSYSINGHDLTRPAKYAFQALFQILNNKNGHHNELFDSFNFNLDKYVRSYIEARIIAHSGLLTRKFVRQRSLIHKLNFEPYVSSNQLSSLIVGINQRDILRPARKVKNYSDNSIVIDHTTNIFKS